jgi:hypothetical protein
MNRDEQPYKRQWSGSAQPGAVSEHIDARSKPADHDLQGKPILKAKPLDANPHKVKNDGELGFSPEIRKAMGAILERKR